MKQLITDMTGLIGFGLLTAGVYLYAGLPASLMRIPLYSITDWHRSPISDSHPFDQPGT
ncbi:hypothetical protein [Escherichia coli]|uniref:hypothetical protein n=1 Tax=Escherichia coli TaxID=562 RepID=UPI0016026A88|nr:hypothetical protein [Escherichia coli]